jgi:RNA polymerase sigma-70 factor (ECF subfamily)
MKEITVNQLKQTYMPVQSKYHKTEDQLLSEQSMVEAAKANPAKFEALYNRYYEQIFRYIFQRMDDKEMAFDVTSQVFLKAMLNLKKYEYRGVPFASWLYRIAKSEVYQSFKNNKANRSVNVESLHVYDMMDEMEENPLEEYHDQLIELIGDLPEEELQIIEMRYFEKRPFREIGEILNITENNAKVKAYRILGKLKKKFKANK